MVPVYAETERVFFVLTVIQIFQSLVCRNIYMFLYMCKRCIISMRHIIFFISLHLTCMVIQDDVTYV